MKRLVLFSAVILLLAGPSCNSDSETEWCPDACTIWSECTGWEYDTCISECQAEGDWDASYLSCLRNQSCDNLDACG